MSTQTTNLGLVKPEPTDAYDIGVHNGNMDIIDEVLGKVDTNTVTEHIADEIVHITNEERTRWDSKVDVDGTVTNADMVDGKHASDFTELVKVTFVYDANVSVEDKIIEYVDSLPTYSLISVVLFSYGSEYLLFVQKYGSGNHASVVCLGYRAENPYYLKKSEGIWTKYKFNDGGNADTLDNHHASDFILASSSAKVVVSSTAPTDTSVVWIVPS